MAYLSPQTLTHGEQKEILKASSQNPRDHLIYSLALGTGLRLAEVVGLNVGDLYLPDGKPRGRIQLRRELVKGGRAADVFLPDPLVRKLRSFRSHKSHRREARRLPFEPSFANARRCECSVASVLCRPEVHPIISEAFSANEISLYLYFPVTIPKSFRNIASSWLSRWIILFAINL